MSDEEIIEIAEHYNEKILEDERKRLSEHAPVEFATTVRFLRSYVPERSVVADIGVGAGHYAELLARMGCKLHLVDIADELLGATVERLEEAGLGEQICGVHRSSAIDLEFLDDASLDAVLLLGPLYHLRAYDDRLRCVHEARRVLKDGGTVFAGGINRLAYLRDLFTTAPDEGAARRDFHARFLSDGNVDPDRAPPLGYAHLTTVAEMRNLFTSRGFEAVVTVGLESFLGHQQEDFNELDDADKEAWLELVWETCTTPEGLGASEHFLFMGRKS